MSLDKVIKLITSRQAIAPIFLVIFTLFFLVRCVAASKPDYKSDPTVDQMCAKQVAKEVKSYGYGTKARVRHRNEVDRAVKKQCSINPNGTKR